MQVVPVMDLKHGEVVHARRGARAAYRPLVTPLSATAAPLDVVAGFLALYPFTALYVADLDAISGDGDNIAALAAIRRAFPSLTLWVDCGIATAAAAASWFATGLGDLVLGSESQADTALLDSLTANRHVLLSLDFRGDSFLGPQQILADPVRWPQTVIVMTLARVGAKAGPDLARLADLRARAPHKRLVAAGGIRHAGDLATLAGMGVSAALVATALHGGALDAPTLAHLDPKTVPQN